MLAEQTPTRFVAFDLLAYDDESLLELPQRERRDRLEAMIAAAGRPHAGHRGPRGGRAVARTAPRA